MAEQKKYYHPLLLIVLTVLSGVLAAASLSFAGGYLVLFEQLAGSVQLIAPLLTAGVLIIWFLSSGFAAFLVSEWMRSYPKNGVIWFAAGLAGLSAIPLFYLSAGYFSVLPVILTLSFLLSGVLMSRALSTGESKTNVILYGSVPSVLLSVVVLLIYAFMSEPSGSFLTGLVDRMRGATEIWSERMTDMALSDPLTAKYMQYLLEQYELIGKGADLAQVGEMAEKLFASGAELLMMLLPGLIIACHNLSGYFTTLSVSAFSRVQDRSKPFRLTASVFGAVLFLICQFAPSVFAFFSGMETILTVALNISVVFTPLFFAIGIRALCGMKRKNLKRNILFVILGVILILSSPVVFISMLGGYFVLSEALRKKMEQMFNINNNEK